MWTHTIVAGLVSLAASAATIFGVRCPDVIAKDSSSSGNEQSTNTARRFAGLLAAAQMSSVRHVSDVNATAASGVSATSPIVGTSWFTGTGMKRTPSNSNA